MSHSLDPDVLAELKKRISDFHEGPNDVLRRLLGLSSRADKRQTAQIQVGNHSKMGELLGSPKFQLSNGIERYLQILGFLHAHYTERFSALDGFSVGKRIHISQNPAQIESSGSETAPRKIPHSPFYVLTRLSNHDKRHMLERILLHVGCSEPDRSLALETLPNSGISRSRPLNFTDIV